MKDFSEKLSVGRHLFRNVGVSEDMLDEFQGNLVWECELNSTVSV
jgi:hypothetical protein